ncbi:tRNA-dihydrouridine synthase family protein [Spirochaetota bacterium]
MAEISTPALRQVIKGFSEKVVLFSEMLNANEVVSNSHLSKPLFKKYEFDDPFIFQIIGENPQNMAEACAIISDKGCFSVDINMGCPSSDMAKKGYGAILLDNLKRAKEIIRSCRSAAKTRLSAKIRSGYMNDDTKKLLIFVKMLEDEGVDFITLHPRFAKLHLSRKANWDLIKLIKKNVKIPVIGNGDIDGPEIAIKRMNETGCNGIMIGREAVKSPWIFKLCNTLNEKKEINLDINIEKPFIQILELIRKYTPPILHRRRAHKFCYFYSDNVKFSHELFKKIKNTDKIDDMKILIYDYFDRNPGEVLKRYKYS